MITKTLGFMVQNPMATLKLAILSLTLKFTDCGPVNSSGC